MPVRSDGLRLGGIDARDEHVLPGARQLRSDGCDLVGRLGLAQDDLGDARAQRPVVVDGREPEIAERQVTQFCERLLHRRAAGANPLEKGNDTRRVHASPHLPQRGRSVD
jgi:hypothetical protein